MTVVANRFGPGTFKLGPTASALDFSCQVQSMTLTVNKNEGDTVHVLCGDTVPGGVTYDYKLAGTFVQDLSAAAAAGLVAYTWAHMGEAVAFEFTPTTAATTKVAGTLVVDPLPIGGDEFGKFMTADYEFTVVGKPATTFPVSALAEAAGVVVPAEPVPEPVPA